MAGEGVTLERDDNLHHRREVDSLEQLLLPLVLLDGIDYDYERYCHT